jgi:hypothetical protein
MHSRCWILLVALLALVIRFHNLTEVLVGGHLYFIDADCYSRMSRAQMVSKAPGTVVHYQQFENWPDGVVSHATAPLDYLIVGMERVLRTLWPVQGRFASLAEQTLDVAGALVSPLLGALLCLIIAFWARSLRLTDGKRPACWWMAPLLLAVSPALVHATVFGRPDHQSLLVFTLGIALVAEHRMLVQPGRFWTILGGVMWGLGLWVSLFEPLILLVANCLLGIGFARGAWKNRARIVWAVCLFAVVVFAYAVEGIPYAMPDMQFRDAFVRWGDSIGELRGLGGIEAFGYWLGALIWIAPVALWICFHREIGPGRGWLKVAGGLAAFTVILTYWQVRWSPYAVLSFALMTPWMLSVPKQAWQGALAGLLALIPVANEWQQSLDLSVEESEGKYLDRSERINARLAADRMRAPEVLPFIAPWWLSPSLAYWSGQPAVAGSGHEGISGILDTARFFLATDPVQARAILNKRGVRLVVASDSARAIQNSVDVLGVAAPPKPLAERLWEPNLEEAWGLGGERNVTTFRILAVMPSKQESVPAEGAPE